jgi:L-gulonolactone oxidase
VALGVLGVVSTVTLQLEPAFKRNLTLKLVHGDDGLEDETRRIAQNVEFGDVTWYPGLRQVVYRYDDRVPVETPGEGRNMFTGFQPQQAAVVAGARASGKESHNFNIT